MLRLQPTAPRRRLRGVRISIAGTVRFEPMILSGARIVTMDAAGTEHERGWLRIEDGLVAELGEGDPPGPADDLRGAVVTPGLVNTHHHLYQTLTRARAQDADLFTWLRTLYPVWARIDDEMLYAAARTGLAELALSGCTTVFDHHYVFPRGVSGLIEAEIARGPGARRSDRRLTRLDGPRRLRRRPAAGQPRRADRRRARRHRAARRSRRRRDGADRGRALLAVLGHDAADGGVRRRRAQARPRPAHAPRGDGRRGRLLPRALRLHAGRVPGAGRLARRRRLVRALHPSLASRRSSASDGTASGSRTARPRTSGSAPASRRCASCSTPEFASGSEPTAPPRTSAAISSSRRSRRCSWRAAGAGPGR